jgi:NAD(P)-dependent dehydrogenase (short-subunit alcohol dehydrogenase family)
MVANRRNKRNVFITGSSGGIGSVSVRKLVKAGYRIYAGVRHPERLKSLAASDVIPVKLDITDSSSIEDAAKFVEEAVGEEGLAGLVNNAGCIVQGPLELLTIDQIREQFNVNVFGQIAVTQAMMPLVRKARGRIINIGAVTGKTTMPFLGALSASKRAMESITDALRVELKPWGIHVIMIEPAAMQTDIFDKADVAATESLEKVPTKKKALYTDVMARVAESMGKQPLNPPEVVADAVVRALAATRPRTRYAVGRGARLVVVLSHLPDRLRDRLLSGALGLK